MKIKRIVPILAIGLVFFWQAAFAAAPPSGVNEVIEDMGVLEENFEGEHWDAAQESVTKIDKTVQEIFTESGLNDPTLVKLLGSLRQTVEKKDERRTEGNYILFQKQFFTFISQFDYDVHPILTMIQQYVVEESNEAFANKDYDDIVSEMQEAGNLIKNAKPLLVEKGIPEAEVDAFKAKVIEAIRAGKNHDDNKIGLLLKEIDAMYGSFLERYKGA